MAKVASTGKDVVVARYFGTSDALDAFLLAFAIAQFASVVLGDSLNEALVPTYIRVREHKGWEAAQRLFSSVMVWSGIILITVSALLALSSSYILPILASNFGPEKLALTQSLFYILLLTVAVYSFGRIWAAILNAGERFALAAAVPIITPIVTVAFIVLTSQVWGIYSYAMAVVGGGVLEAALLAYALRRRGFSLTLRWQGIGTGTRQVLSQYAPLVAQSIVFTSSDLVDRSMATMLGPGSVSVLNYGSKLVQGISAIAILALTQAVLPHFSRMVALSDWGGVRHTLKTYTVLILVVSVPLTLGVVYFSEPLVSLFFQRGAFTAEDTHLVAQVQALFMLQIPFYVLGVLVVRLLASLRGNYWLIWGSFISVIVNISLNYVFMQWLGVAGIALSTSCVYVVSLCYLLLTTLHVLRKAANAQDMQQS